MYSVYKFSLKLQDYKYFCSSPLFVFRSFHHFENIMFLADVSHLFGCKLVLLPERLLSTSI